MVKAENKIGQVGYYLLTAAQPRLVGNKVK